MISILITSDTDFDKIDIDKLKCMMQTDGLTVRGFKDQMPFLEEWLLSFMDKSYLDKELGYDLLAMNAYAKMEGFEYYSFCLWNPKLDKIHLVSTPKDDCYEDLWKESEVLWENVIKPQGNVTFMGINKLY